MIWDLKELQENANTVANNKQVKDILQEQDYEVVWFYFYDQEKQVKYVSEPSDIYSWNVYALLKAGHAYAITDGDKKFYVYCYADIDSPNSYSASYEETLIELATHQSFDSPYDIFDNYRVISSYALSDTKIEDLGKNNLARDLTTLARLHKSEQKSYFNPKYELLGRYKGYYYNHININEDSIKIVLSGKDYVELAIEDYLVALAETEGLKQLDLAFKNCNVSYKLEIDK